MDSKGKSPAVTLLWLLEGKWWSLIQAAWFLVAGSQRSLQDKESSCHQSHCLNLLGNGHLHKIASPASLLRDSMERYYPGQGST